MNLLCTADTVEEQAVQEMVEFTVIYNKQKYEVKFALDETVEALKNHIEKLTGNYDITSCVLYAYLSRKFVNVR